MFLKFMCQSPNHHNPPKGDSIVELGFEEVTRLVYGGRALMMELMFLIGKGKDFTDGPVAKTLCSQCRGPRFHPG